MVLPATEGSARILSYCLQVFPGISYAISGTDLAYYAISYAISGTHVACYGTSLQAVGWYLPTRLLCGARY
eukprot:3889469-Rhodomonas_salina.3